MDTSFGPEDAGAPRPTTPARRRDYPVAIALLLLGGGLAAGGLFLQWWHFTATDGSAFSNPSDVQGTTPALTFGLDDVRVWPLLVCSGVAAAAAVISLMLRGRLSIMLASVTGAAGLVGLAGAYLVATFWFTDAGVIRVLDAGYYTTSLGFLVIIASSSPQPLCSREAGEGTRRPCDRCTPRTKWG